MPPAGFEPTISAGQRPNAYVLDRVAMGPAVNICARIQVNILIIIFDVVAYIIQSRKE